MSCAAIHGNAILESGFQSKGDLNGRRCQRMLSYSAVGRSGASPAVATVAGKHTSNREAIFKAQLRKALEEPRLDRLYPIWQAWVVARCGEVPLDNREFLHTQRQLAAAARGKLRAAVRSGSVELVREALQVADAVAEHWPFAVAVKTSLEYTAARSYKDEVQGEAEQNEEKNEEQAEQEEF
eukprot:CAMPEP_0115295170 /NCGR_PEP_ID=MMETSP0270-20121206/66566_1 /TAXON_ID=71861 /ORGANISM="Scrippsiella trochoidea, Strain CCMP3099" /LENGTH=181 /DNA_ID=CAMNT_0002712731 /DNA_START=53 /DNA_END=598 /DNA_ORIENTATION=-